MHQLKKWQLRVPELSNSFSAVADNAQETMRYSGETANYAKIVETAVEDNLQEMTKIQGVIKIVEKINKA